MAADVVPALNEAIQTSFKTNVMRDRRIAQISGRIRDGTATFKDGHDYAERLGENLSNALKKNLTAETLPDGTLYYNIANRTVTPALEENYNLTNDVAEQIQELLDKKAGIGLSSVKADFPKSRIQGLIDKMTAEGITLEDALIWIGEPIVNNSEAFFDDFIDENAKFRTKAGLKAILTRTAEANCCSWCAALEGTYEYDSAPNDIYRRHEFCRCTVTYQSEKKSQNVWSKREWQSSPEELDRRINFGKEKSTFSPAERIQQANQLYQDMLVRSLLNENPALERAKALRKTRKISPEERLQRVRELEEQRAQGR